MDVKIISSSTFNWSLKPLLFVTNLVGLPLVGSAKKIGRLSNFVRLLVVSCLGCFILLTNIFINGRHRFIIFEKTTEIFAKKEKYESGFGFFKDNPHGLIVVVRETLVKWFFISVPLIHIAFLGMLLFTKNWVELWSILIKIQRKMNLGDRFHCKCRKHCVAVIILLLMVSKKH